MKSVLSYHYIYNHLFKRIKNKYKPLEEYVRLLKGTYGKLEYYTTFDIYAGFVQDNLIIDLEGNTNNMTEFEKHIKPLLSSELVESIGSKLRSLFATYDETDTIYNRKIFELRKLIRDVERHVEIQSALFEDVIVAHLIESVKNYPGMDAYIAALSDTQKKSTAECVDLPLPEEGMTLFDRNAIITAIQSEDNATFSSKIKTHFKCALYDYHTTSTRSTIIPVLYLNAVEISQHQGIRSHMITSLEYDLESANANLKAIIEDINLTSTSGGALENKASKASKYVLVITNTATMQTLNKPIFKIGRQSKVRHNRELVLVSKYKLLLGKRHKRQVRFEICKRA
jgi:hypothetical protein